jgi:hypothetical protein
VNNSEADKISNNEFKRTVVIMADEIKKDMYKHVNEFKEDTNKQ